VCTIWTGTLHSRGTGAPQDAAAAPDALARLSAAGAKSLRAELSVAGAELRERAGELSQAQLALRCTPARPPAAARSALRGGGCMRPAASALTGQKTVKHSGALCIVAGGEQLCQSPARLRGAGDPHAGLLAQRAQG